MSTEPQRTCPSCGNEFSGAMEFCPVCMLRKGLAGGVASGDSSVSDDMAKPKQDQGAQRFEHYELVMGEGGKPVELGRGAMGGTYKAFDINLRCPVTLKVISARYLAKLLAGEDPHNPGQLDTHPLVREYFGEQLQSQRTEAWKECNRRLYNYYRTRAPQLPDSFRETEPLFSAVICGCNAGLFREALHEVYIPRIQRGDVYFAANVLGARGALLLVLVHFFEHGRWGSPVETGVGEQSLTAEDQLFILTQATLYLTATRGPASPEMRICYELAEPLCHSLNRPLLLYVTLMGQWRYSLNTEKLTATMRIAERVCSLAEEQNNPALIVGACHISAATL